WTEVTVRGRSAHCGTTPMERRRDAACAAAEIALFVRKLARDMGGYQKGTVGRIELYPNLINVIPERAVLTVDMRNLDDGLLARAEQEFAAFLERLAGEAQVTIESRGLGRFAPVIFPESVVGLVETTARDLGLPCRRMPSGAGHDAQMMARMC